jgi:CubicO group peptidase (beta-lactamase class C family)
MYFEKFKVGSFSHAAKILPSKPVARGGEILPLPRGDATPVSYTYQGQRRTLDDYLERQRTSAILILRNGQIVSERYRYDRAEDNRFLSFSVAKSINSMLIGIALEKGIIHSLDDAAEKYVAELKGSLYGATTIRQLLHMSSGVTFAERYDGKDDIYRLMLAERGIGEKTPLQFLASFTERSFPAGEKTSYSSSETTVLGYVLRRAANRPITELTEEWLWKPLGAESDAAWNYSVDGQEGVEGRFNATLRDYGRIGLLLANDGALRGQQIVPREYLLDATDADRQLPPFRPHTATPYYGYGSQFWILPLKSRTFACLGIYGQAIFVQPETKIVMVHLGVWREAKDIEASRERDALWRGVLASLGGRLEPWTASNQ